MEQNSRIYYDDNGVALDPGEYVGMKELAPELGVRNSGHIGKLLRDAGLYADNLEDGKSLATQLAVARGVAVNATASTQDGSGTYKTAKWRRTAILPELRELLAKNPEPATKGMQRENAHRVAFDSAVPLEQRVAALELRLEDLERSLRRDRPQQGYRS